ncbi:hypothetical protein Vafri_8227 [Volvox africanus]|nr:hypothetical protein Vafri_8227 [Volvox africanus]
MALADKTAAGKRIMELYKDDAEMCSDLLASLLDLDAAKFSEFRDMWVITLGSPVEKLFLKKKLPDMAAGPGPSSTRTSAGESTSHGDHGAHSSIMYDLLDVCVLASDVWKRPCASHCARLLVLSKVHDS